MSWALALAIASAAIVFAALAAAREARRTRALRRLLAIEAGDDPTEPPADAVATPLGRAIHAFATDQRRRRLELARERDERERIMTHLDAGVALLDDAGRVVRANHALADLLGLPMGNPAGRPLVEWVRAPALEDLVVRCRRERRTIEVELRLWVPHERVIRATATPLGQGAVGGMVLVLQDLTEAERVTRMRQDFVANVSHELRTPLTSLKGYAETLLEGGLDDAEHRERFVRVMHDQTARLQAMVEDLLTLAEVERPDAVRRLETFDLRDRARAVVASFRDDAARRALTLSLEPGEPVPVEAEPRHLDRVLANLVDNAIKYTEQGGVVVRVGSEDGLGWAEVEDTGPGIADEHLTRIFERFYRVDPARSRDRGGTGLGLSIVKHVVERHRGRVTVRSGRGKGATFRFEIPSRAAIG
jgi:two-component system phosphate regulon sensor histidine kinase PhoR